MERPWPVMWTLGLPCARRLCSRTLSVTHPALLPSKVLVGAQAVLANGGVISACGINMVALAAKKHSVPFVVLVGLHKLSPLFPHDPDLVYNGEFFELVERIQSEELFNLYNLVTPGDPLVPYLL